MVLYAGYHAKGHQVNSHQQSFFNSCFYEMCVQRQWGHQVLLKTPTLVVRVQLTLG